MLELLLELSHALVAFMHLLSCDAFDDIAERETAVSTKERSTAKVVLTSPAGGLPSKSAESADSGDTANHSEPINVALGS